MNKEEILAMKAGRELDAIIGSILFGYRIEWHWCWCEPECGEWEEIESIHDEKWINKLIESHKGWGEDRVVKLPCYCVKQDYWRPLEFYSTDILAAWQVVAEMRGMEDGEGNQLFCCLKIHCDIPGEVWDIHWSYSELSIMNDGHKDHKLPLSWYSFPEAICKAVLLTKLEGAR